MNVLSEAKAGMQSVSQSLARDQLLSFSARGVFFSVQKPRQISLPSSRAKNRPPIRPRGITFVHLL